MHAPPPQAGENDATGIVSGLVSVELPGVDQSTSNFQRSRLLVPRPSRKSGEPDGGGVDPSRVEGSRLE
jgi:hypothetical protein